MKVFIGSSSESFDRIVTPLMKAMGDYAKRREDISFLPQLWKDDRSFIPGDQTLSSILSAINGSDFAIFVFAKDDKLLHRSEEIFAPRDNVVFEAGLSVALLGETRTLLIVEQGAKFPTDIAGLNLEFIDVAAGQLSINCNSIAKNLFENIYPRLELRDDERGVILSDFGIGETIEQQKNRISALEDTLVSVGITTGAELHDPIEFGAKTCVSAYVEALSRTRERFWTTTYLSSGFWQSNASDVMAANNKLHNRLKQDTGDNIRRLLLLPYEVEQFFATESEEISVLRRLHNDKALDGKENVLDGLRQYMSQLEEAGCRIRVGYDSKDSNWGRLTRKLKSTGEPGDIEMAIYDDNRIDMFEGGKSGHISKVSIFPAEIANFKEHLHSAETYFESVWETAQDGTAFLNEWHSNFLRAKQRIDYHRNWIAKYEYSLSDGDKKTKQAEFDATLTTITRHQEAPIDSYLDIGTCTARYPIRLKKIKDFFAGNANIVAIDEDADCISFSEVKIEEEGLKGQIKLVLGNFLTPRLSEIEGKKFKLITCMLGTISHFGNHYSKRRQDRFADTRRAINKMSELMDEQGLLVIGNWSEVAKKQGDFLSIYRRSDAKILEKCTPTDDELFSFLDAAGLTSVERTTAGPNIDLIIAKKSAER